MRTRVLLRVYRMTVTRPDHVAHRARQKGRILSAFVPTARHSAQGDGQGAGQTQEGYDRMIAALGPAIQQAKGFIAHGAGPAGDVWRVFEIWESQADAAQFFAKYIHPNLPKGVKPKRSVLELHSLITAWV